MVDSDIFIILSNIFLFVGWIIAVAGFGSLIMNLFPREFRVISYRGWYQSIFGLICIGSLATIINFFIPVSPGISYLLLSFGILLFLVEVRKKKPSLLKAVIFGVMSIIIGLDLIYYGAPVTDTGLYHLTVIRWIMENATPFGLANLHTRFGFNTIWFPISAVIDQNSILLNRPIFFLNSILFIFYTTLVIDTLSSVITGPHQSRRLFHTIFNSIKNISVSSWFILLTVLPVVMISVRLKNFLFSPSPDYPVFLLTLIFFAFLIEYIEYRVSFSDVRTFLLIFLVIFICTIKVSGIILVPMVLIAILYQSMRIIRNKVTGSGYPVLVERMVTEIRSIPPFFLFITLFLVLPYGIRGTIISGNPLFPAPFGSYLQFPWSMPVDRAISVSNEVTAWARLPGENYMSSLGNYSWLHDWTINFIQTLFPLILGIIGAGLIAAVILLYAWRRRLIQPDRPSLIPAWYPLITVLVGLIFWFSMYPDYRFALGYFSALPLILITCPFIILKRPFSSLFIIFIFMSIIGAILGAGAFIIADHSQQITDQYEGIPVFPDVPYTIKETYNGESVYVPREGSQVWNMPIPNTPYFEKNLTIIRDVHTQAYLMFIAPGRIP